jgi:hypothetical protein
MELVSPDDDQVAGAYLAPENLPIDRGMEYTVFALVGSVFVAIGVVVNRLGSTAEGRPVLVQRSARRAID